MSHMTCESIAVVSLDGLVDISSMSCHGSHFPVRLYPAIRQYAITERYVHVHTLVHVHCILYM